MPLAPTAAPTVTATPTQTETPSPTPTPEPTAAPVPNIEGLAVAMENGRLVYRAAADNPYGLPVGAFAGYLFAFDDQTGETFGQGLALAAEVRRVLLTQANSPEAIANGDWRMTFGFDPHGDRIVIRQMRDQQAIILSRVAPDTEFRSPFLEATVGFCFPQDKFGTISITVPEALLAESLRGINYSIGYYFRSANLIGLPKWDEPVSFDQMLFGGISESPILLSSLPSDSQIIMTDASLNGSVDFSMGRFLTVGGCPVFSTDTDQPPR